MNLVNDRKYAIGMLLLSIIYCVSAWSLDTDFDPVNEKFYPFVLSVLMILLSIGLLIWPSPQSTTGANTVRRPVNWKNLQKIGLTFSAILVYSFVLHKIGFIISASLLMAICMWVFEASRKWILPASIIVSIVFYIIFDRLLGLNLPAGLLSFV